MRRLKIAPLVAVIWLAFSSHDDAQRGAEPRTADADFETAFAAARQDPDWGEAIDTLALSFPADFARFRDLAYARSLSAEPGFKISSVTQTFIAAVVDRELPNIAQAPDADLIRFAYAARDAYRIGAERDPALCIRLDAGALRNDEPVNSAAIGAYAQWLRALLLAAAAGRAAPVERDLGPPSEVERNLWAAAFAQTDMTAAEATLLDDPSDISEAAPVAVCRFSRVVMDGLLIVPPEIAARGLAVMLGAAAEPSD